MNAFPKRQLHDLAIFGGPKAFKEKLHVGAPNVGNRESLFQRIDAILGTRWLTNNGPYVQEFEKLLAEKAGVKHCLAICNGTIALEIAIRALDLSGEVIVPSFTFVSTAHALQWHGIKPVFCDIDPRTHNIDPCQIESLITERTSGIMAVHLWGRPCEIDELEKVADKHQLKLVFDAAHAVGVSHQGRMIGSFGDAEIFSFHATKYVNTFEGGAVLTNDDLLADRIRKMRNLGFSGRDNVVSVGTNGKMSEVSAAMGLTMFESMEHLIQTNSEHHQQYSGELAETSGVKVIDYPEEGQSNFQYVVLELDRDAPVSRDPLVDVLNAENVLARRYFYPGCHRMEPYVSAPYAKTFSLPHTENVAANVLTLPTGSIVKQRDIRLICQIIRFCLTHGGEIEAELCGRSSGEESR